MYSQQNDTICAVASPPGEGAVSIIRVSGAESLSIVRGIAPFLPQEVESHKIYYGHLIDRESNTRLDEVLLAYFAKGRSFTGESTVEIFCHGSPVVVEGVLQVLISSGARAANRGEFTFRAFMNGRIDLAQAEGVLALIQSQSARASSQALRLLGGETSKEVSLIEENLVWALSRLEANIDFASEDIEFASHDEIVGRLIGAKNRIESLLRTYKAGRILKAGLRVAIIGAPNVGKSSLLNALAEENRAIVSARPGTTRDAIAIDIQIDGHKVAFVDTAGLRDSDDEIECIGIARAHEELKKSDLVLFIYDQSAPDSVEEILELYDSVESKLAVANKVDLISPDLNLQSTFNPALLDSTSAVLKPDVCVSALSGQGISELKLKIAQHIRTQFYENNNVVMSARQFELLGRMSEFVDRGIKLALDCESPEFIISDIQAALELCMEIVGKKFDDQILDRVFKDFCLGK